MTQHKVYVPLKLSHTKNHPFFFNKFGYNLNIVKDYQLKAAEIVFSQILWGNFVDRPDTRTLNFLKCKIRNVLLHEI